MNYENNESAQLVNNTVCFDFELYKKIKTPYLLNRNAATIRCSAVVAY